MTELNQNNININNMVLWLSKFSMFIPSAFINSDEEKVSVFFFSFDSKWWKFLMFATVV